MLNNVTGITMRSTASADHLWGIDVCGGPASSGLLLQIEIRFTVPDNKQRAH